MEKTHNLEVIGSSPIWSTNENQALTNFIASAFSFAGDLQVTFLKENSSSVTF